MRCANHHYIHGKCVSCGERKLPWECTDCKDTGVAGRGTRQDFCTCKYGKEFKAEVFAEAQLGLPDISLK